MENEVTQYQGQAAPPMSIDDMKRQAKGMLQLMKEVMREGVDYGQIPGCPKKSLWQPGAEKTCLYFGVYVDVMPNEVFDPSHSRTLKVEEKKWDPAKKKMAGTGVFKEIECNGYYEVNTTAYLKRKVDGSVIAVASATCNNFEKKYAAQDVYDVKNTIMAMSQKRAYVRVVRNGTAASDVFTDPDIPEGLWDTEEQAEQEERRQAPKPVQEKQQGGGAGTGSEGLKENPRDTLKRELMEYVKGDMISFDALLKELSTIPGSGRYIQAIDSATENWCGSTLGRLRKLREEKPEYDPYAGREPGNEG